MNGILLFDTKEIPVGEFPVSQTEKKTKNILTPLIFYRVKQ